jgi:hypothetical protein
LLEVQVLCQLLLMLMIGMGHLLLMVVVGLLLLLHLGLLQGLLCAASCRQPLHEQGQLVQ